MDMYKDFNQDHILISAPAASMFTVVPSFQQLEPTVNVLGDKSHNLSSKIHESKIAASAFLCLLPFMHSGIQATSYLDSSFTASKALFTFHTLYELSRHTHIPCDLSKHAPIDNGWDEIALWSANFK